MRKLLGTWVTAVVLLAAGGASEAKGLGIKINGVTPVTYYDGKSFECIALKVWGTVDLDDPNTDKGTFTVTLDFPNAGCIKGFPIYVTSEKYGFAGPGRYNWEVPNVVGAWATGLPAPNQTTYNWPEADGYKVVAFCTATNNPQLASENYFFNLNYVTFAAPRNVRQVPDAIDDRFRTLVV